MKQRYWYAIAMVISWLAIILNSCRHQILNNGNEVVVIPSASTCSTDTVYFINDIMPIISSNCTMSGCHDNISHKDGVNLTTYSNIIQQIRAGDAANSKLYKSIIKTNGDRMPPPPMPAFTTAQKALIQKWINQGARNNNCTGRCDTALFTYSGAVKPIMDSKCAGCHNPASLGGNIDVSTYNAVKTIALNGKLYGSVAHQTGYSPMPKNAAKLSDCEIRQVQKWIGAGSQNN